MPFADPDKRRAYAREYAKRRYAQLTPTELEAARKVCRGYSREHAARRNAERRADPLQREKERQQAAHRRENPAVREIERLRAQENRMRRKTLAENASANGRPYTEDEDSIVLDSSLTVSEAAIILNRTYGSVSERRRRLRKKGELS